MKLLIPASVKQHIDLFYYDHMILLYLQKMQYLMLVDNVVTCFILVIE